MVNMTPMARGRDATSLSNRRHAILMPRAGSPPGELPPISMEADEDVEGSNLTCMGAWGAGCGGESDRSGADEVRCDADSPIPIDPFFPRRRKGA